MTKDSMIISIADALGVSPFMALPIVLGLALAVAALVATIGAATWATRPTDSGLGKAARHSLEIARRNAARNNRAAQDRPAVWRRQVRTEGAVYIRTLRVQLRQEQGGF